MIGNLVLLLIVLALAVLFGWLARRAWHSRHRLLKWPALILSGLLTLVLLLAFVLGLVGAYRLYAPATNPVATVRVDATPDQVARGAKFALFCAGCHSSTGQPPLNGGSDNFVGPLGTIYPPNLTPAGEIKNWSDGEIVRAIREGIHQSGRPLLIMPSDTFHHLSDADVQSIVAYLRSQPAVSQGPQQDTPSNGVGIVGVLLVGAGVFQTSAQPPITQPIVAPTPGTADYGQYLVSVIGCRLCHGANLAGGTANDLGPPAGPNLTVLVPKWSQADFAKTIRTGVDPTGHTLSDQMPWKEISGFASDDDLKAMFDYLHGLTPIVVPPK